MTAITHANVWRMVLSVAILQGIMVGLVLVFVGVPISMVTLLGGCSINFIIGSATGAYLIRRLANKNAMLSRP